MSNDSYVCFHILCVRTTSKRNFKIQFFAAAARLQRMASRHFLIFLKY
jgi:hypothetical protein